MASPDLIARAAEARSPVRSAMLRLGEAAICSTRARRLRSVCINNNDAKPTDHRIAERRAQRHEGEKRHAEYQEERDTIVQQPTPFARGDQSEPGLRSPSHSRVRQSR